ncbi:MAG: hypothetical protein WC455_10350 [Dehalococcoidia bacterium]|jgi:hypothetical protein
MTPTQQDIERAEDIAKKHSYCDVKFDNCKCCSELAKVIAQALAEERERTWRKAKNEEKKWLEKTKSIIMGKRIDGNEQWNGGIERARNIIDIQGSKLAQSGLTENEI